MTSILPSKKANTSPLVIWLLIFLAATFSLLRLGYHSLWLDEALTIKNATDITHLIGVLTTSEPYMWTYMLVLNVWLKIGTSEFFVRLLSSIFFIAGVIVFFQTWKIIHNTKVSLLASLIYILHPFIIKYSQEVRAYSMTLFFMGLSTYFFVKLIKESKPLDLFYYTVASVFLVYTHHFGFLILGAQLVFALLKLRPLLFKHKLIWGFGGVLIASYPLLVINIPENAINWIPEVGERGLVHFLLSIGGGNFVGTLVLVFCFLTGSWYVLTKHLKNQGKEISLEALPVFLFFVPPVLTLFYSLMVKPAFVSRYLIIVIPWFIVLAAYALARLALTKSIFVSFIILGSLGWSLLAWYGWRLPAAGSWEKTILGSNENWRLATSTITERAEMGDSVIFYSYYVRVPFEYYLNRLNYADHFFMPELASQNYTLGGVMPAPNKAILTDLLPQKSGDVWLVLSHHTNSKLGRTEQAEEIKGSLVNNYNEFFVGDYDGILIYQYVKK